MEKDRAKKKPSGNNQGRGGQATQQPRNQNSSSGGRPATNAPTGPSQLTSPFPGFERREMKCYRCGSKDHHTPLCESDAKPSATQKSGSDNTSTTASSNLNVQAPDYQPAFGPSAITDVQPVISQALPIRSTAAQACQQQQSGGTQEHAGKGPSTSAPTGPRMRPDATPYIPTSGSSGAQSSTPQPNQPGLSSLALPPSSRWASIAAGNPGGQSAQTSSAPNPPVYPTTPAARPPPQPFNVGRPSTSVASPAAPPSSGKYVLTNHLSIDQLPRKVYVYEILFNGMDTNGNTIPVTRKFEKECLFGVLRNQPGYADVRTQTNWVTDHTMIWSTRPLFATANPNPNPNPVTVVNGVNGITAFNPYSQRTVHAISGAITFDCVIDSAVALAQPLGNSTGHPRNLADRALLERGLNAMISQQAQAAARRTPNPTLKQVGANKFYRTHPASQFNLDLTGNVRGFEGYFLSARPGEGQYFLNVSLRCSPFLKSGLGINAFIDSFHNASKATSNLRGVKVQNIAQTQFNGIDFIHGVTGARNNFNVNVGTTNNPISVQPRDLTTFEDSPYRQPLTGRQTSAMIQNALKRPGAHRLAIQNNAIPDLGLNLTTFRNTLHTQFNLVIQTNLQRIPCRFLPAPVVRYSGAISAQKSNASWNLKGMKVFQPRPGLTTVIVLDLARLAQHSRRLRAGFENALRKALTDLGINAQNDLVNELQFHLARYNNPGNVTFVIALPEHSYEHYSKIKRVAELRLGVQTVCVVNPAKTDVQFCANIALKLNLKGNGTNHHIDRQNLIQLYNRTECDTIVIGADITHPMGHCATGCPSIAAVVGSVDDGFAKFPGSMRLQNGRKEMITDLADMVMERLVDWARLHNGELPRRMLFYRDGVSESQYQSVINDEISQLPQAFAMAYKVVNNIQGTGKVPEVPFELTFVVVGKRHHTRFFPESKEDMLNPGNENVKPGLVVDRIITSQGYLNFYLQSHNPIHGTGKSAHYVVLKDGMALGLDNIQKLTHAFCYNYARATKGVSYCGPAYYADRLCDRGRAYIRDWLLGQNGAAPGRQRMANETNENYLTYVANYLHNQQYYRPNRLQKYGRERKNPWHPNLDDIMFYL
ncbi:hypothetical protein Q7P37_010230 [Cladosporium fusiforme]